MTATVERLRKIIMKILCSMLVLFLRPFLIPSRASRAPKNA